MPVSCGLNLYERYVTAKRRQIPLRRHYYRREMKQSLILTHFPLKKGLENKTVEGESGYKRRCLSTAYIAPIPPPVSSETSAPDLSRRTKSVLQELCIRRPDRPAPTVEEILGSVPAKEKHQGLLQRDRQLPLPCEYQRLVTLLESCDSVLNFMKQRHTETSFPAVRRAVESMCGLQFSEYRLQQVLAALPGAYELCWVKDPGRGFLLVLDFPIWQGKRVLQFSQPELEHRKALIYMELMTRTKRLHAAFLQALPGRPQIHPERIRSWYHNFDLHAVPTIAPAPLPRKPIDEAWESVKEFIRTQKDESAEEGSRPRAGKSLLSQAILDKVRQGPEPTSSLLLDQRRSHLLCLCDTLTSLFAPHRTPSLFLSSLLPRLSRHLSLSETAVAGLIEELVDLFPSWLRLFPTSMGTVLRLNRHCELGLDMLRAQVSSRYSNS